MTQETQVPEPQDAEGQDTEDQDPFAGFFTEGFEGGVAEAVDTEAVKPSQDDEDAARSPEDGEEDPEGTEGGERPPKPKQTAQERINELTKLRREAEREAEDYKARLQEYERQRQEPPREEPPREEPKAPEPQRAEGEAEGPPDPQDFEYGELDSRYITALVDYQTDLRWAKHQRKMEEQWEQAQVQQEQAATREKFNAKVDEGSKKHEDFYDKVVIGAEKGAWALSEDLGKLLVDSEVGDDIAYYLATHPEESATIYRQSPVEQARFFGRMEAKFSADRTAAPGKSEVKTPKAPPPVLPARGSDGKFQPSADSDDFSAFERHAQSQGR